MWTHDSLHLLNLTSTACDTFRDQPPEEQRRLITLKTKGINGKGAAGKDLGFWLPKNTVSQLFSVQLIDSIKPLTLRVRNLSISIKKRGHSADSRRGSTQANQQARILYRSCAASFSSRLSVLRPGAPRVAGHLGYTEELADNLLTGVRSEWFEDEYRRSAGCELDWGPGRSEPPKMHAHSSAALVVYFLTLAGQSWPTCPI